MNRIVLLVSVLLASGVRAEQPREAFDRELAAARALYDELEYEQALKAFRKALPLAPTPEDQVRVHLYEGIVAAEIEQPRAADTAFKAAVALDPDAELPTQVSPKMRARFEQARAQERRKLGDAEVERLRAAKRTRLEAAEARAHPPPPPPPIAPPPPTVPIYTLNAPPSPPLRQYAWIPAAAGAGVAVAGTALYFVARGNYQGIVDGTLPQSRVAAAKAQGQREQIAAWSLIGIGAAGLLAGGGLALFGGPMPAIPVAWVGDGAGGILVSGALP